jgi:hypothetical protein
VAANVSSEVSAPRTISINFITGGGFIKCIPITFHKRQQTTQHEFNTSNGKQNGKGSRTMIYRGQKSLNQKRNSCNDSTNSRKIYYTLWKRVIIICTLCKRVIIICTRYWYISQDDRSPVVSPIVRADNEPNQLDQSLRLNSTINQNNQVKFGSWTKFNESIVNSSLKLWWVGSAHCQP